MWADSLQALKSVLNAGVVVMRRVLIVDTTNADLLLPILIMAIHDTIVSRT